MWVEIWVWLSEHVAILAALLTFSLTVGWQAITRWLAPRPKLIYAFPQNNSFLVPFDPQPTEDNPVPARQISRYVAQGLFVQNMGGATAEEVEIVFNWVPQHLEHFPQIPITKYTDESGRLVVTVPRLNPKEVVTFSLLSLNADLPGINYVRCKGFGARYVAVQNSRVFPKLVNWGIWWLMVAGIAATIYIALQIAIWLFAITSVAR